MIIKKMLKIINLIISINLFLFTSLYCKDISFESWLNNFKIKAIKSGVSVEVTNDVLSGAKYLPKVIEYDRYQPEFYEDTFTYIKKRTSKKKVKEGVKLYLKDKNLIDKVENEFEVEENYCLH